MKKFLLVTFIFTFILSATVLANPLKDIQTHWAKDNIQYLVDREVIDGYPDGTFKPDNEVNVDAFIKMTVTALGHILENGSPYWASTFIDKSKELGLVIEGEYENYEKPITRVEMARIITRSLNEGYSSNLYEYSGLIKDYSNIRYDLQDYVVKAYSKGIITGYPDKTFQPVKKATRAESATMIVRLIDPTVRKVPTLPEKLTINGKEVVTPHPEILPHVKKAIEIFNSVDYGHLYNEYFLEDNKIQFALYESKEAEVGAKEPIISYHIKLEKDPRSEYYYPYSIFFYKSSNTAAQNIYSQLLDDLYPEIKEMALNALNENLKDINYTVDIINVNQGNRNYMILTYKGSEMIFVPIGLED